MIVRESDTADGGEKTKNPDRIRPDWYPLLRTFRKSDNRTAVWQLLNTLIPYGFCWYLMVWSIRLGYPYWMTLILVLPASAFLVRIFILFHDCVHGSFFACRKANTFFGYFLGVMVFTPFEDWRFSHLRHHASYANLDARGFGDIWTLTLQEYKELPNSTRWMYKFYRNPLVLMGLGAVWNFLLSNRLPARKMKRNVHMSVLLTNLLMLAVFLVANRLIGWPAYLLIQLPVLCLAGAAGIWLFYVQHQFKGGYWARKGEWDPLRAAMEGSSFYKLPVVLRWFSGNIGFHHVHHLNPGIPNYRLKKCYDAIPALSAKEPLTIAESLSFIRLKFWDEERKEMVGYPS